MGERKKISSFFCVVVVAAAAAFIFFSFTKFPHPIIKTTTTIHRIAANVKREYGVKIERETVCREIEREICEREENCGK